MKEGDGVGVVLVEGSGFRDEFEEVFLVLLSFGMLGKGFEVCCFVWWEVRGVNRKVRLVRVWGIRNR